MGLTPLGRIVSCNGTRLALLRGGKVVLRFIWADLRSYKRCRAYEVLTEFGETYARYAANTPAFFPHLGYMPQREAER